MLDRVALPFIAMRFLSAKGLEAMGLGDRSRVPLSLDGLDDTWFEQKFDGTLASLQVTGGSTGTTQRRGFALAWDGNNNLPRDIFVKMSASLGTRITGGISGAMENEAWFYNELRPRLTIEAPAGYYAAFERFSGRSIQVIEDVGVSKGAQFLDALSPITKEMATGQMVLLARLHGQGKVLAQNPGTPLTYQKFVTLGNRRAMIKRFHFRGLAKMADALPARFAARQKASWQVVEQSTAMHLTLPHTVIHCDVHPGNWYQCADGTMGLMDWQCVSRGHWSRDLAYCLAAGLSIENRRSWEGELIELYLEELAAAGGDVVSLDDANHLYRSQLAGALAFWTPTYAPPPLFPAMQPENVAHEVVLRIATAMDDLDALDFGIG